VEKEPLDTSYGADSYRQIFGVTPASRVNRNSLPSSL
jgi:hypothetical protein